MQRIAGRGRNVAALVVLAALALAAPQAATAQAIEPPRSTAGPADPGTWNEIGFSPIRTDYYQGITSAPGGDLYFDGFIVGLYRTTSALVETARNNRAIPPDVVARERYNHIGDLTWDDAEGGRLLLPLECYLFGAGNFCGTGSIGVADPATLAWRYYVKLDPADIKKAMWAEVSPDGSLVWTSSGSDLLAYATADVSLANAAPAAAPIRPVRRLVGAVPPSGVTGATFHGDRLLLAGQDTAPNFQVWSIDTETGERQLEIERVIYGESEGLDIFEGFGGVLHWQIAELSFGNVPTYGYGRNALVHFARVNRPPDCSAVHASKSSLWPPNHKFVRVVLTGASDPDGDPVSIAVKTVTQDEPVHGWRRHGTSPDAFKAKRSDAVWLRAERSEHGDGRVYHVAFEASDGAAGTCEGEVRVDVPRNRKRGAVDSSPPSYDSFSRPRHDRDDDD